MFRQSVFQRLRERKVVQWTAAYVVVALGVMEFMEGFGARWGVTEQAQRRLDVALVIGLGATIVVAWFHGEKGRQRVGALEVGALGMVLLIGTFLAGRLGGADPLPSFVPPRDVGLAVLPFVDLSPGEEDDYFVGSMHEELTTVLGRELPARVIAASAMRRYAASDLGPAEIAAELGVRYAVAGTVRLAGETMRLTLEMLDEAQTVLWTQSYDATLDPERMLEVQEQIAGEIASTLALEIRQAEVPIAAGTEGRAAYVLYLQALDRLRRIQDLGRRESEAEWVLAIDLLEEAIRLDPSFVPALASHSTQLVEWVNRGVAPSTMTGGQIDSIYALALESVERANTIAPDDPAATAALASFKYFVDRDYPAAIDLAERTLGAHPSHYEATRVLALSNRRLGRLSQASASLRDLIGLDPLDPSLYGAWFVTLLADRRFDQAERTLEEVERRFPGGSWNGRSELAALRGDTAMVRRAAEACSPPGCTPARLNAALYLGGRPDFPEPPPLIFQAILAEMAGEEEPADALYRAAAAELENRAGLEGEWCPGSLCGNRIGEGGQLAFARAKLGDTTGARGALQEARRLAAIEPRDLWAAPDFDLWRLASAVALSDRTMWTQELAGLLTQRSRWFLTPAQARLHPLLAPVLDDPEFGAILGAAPSR